MSLAVPCARTRGPQQSLGPQIEDELVAHSDTGLHGLHLVNRLVEDPREHIVGMVDAEATGDLLYYPHGRPPPVLAVRLIANPHVPVSPARRWGPPIDLSDYPGKVVLDTEV